MITVIIPAAGLGQRFKDAGYKEPKPLINVCGKTMIRRVMDNVDPGFSKGRAFFIIGRTKDKLGGYGNWVSLEEPTEGAVDTILKARKHISEEPLLIANCDQLVNFDVNDFIEKSAPNGSLVTFKSNKPHHSYVKIYAKSTLNDPEVQGVIAEIKEKEVISNQAVSGVYYFTKGTDFLESADKVLAEDKKVKGEFYVSSVIDLMIKDGKKLNTYEAETAILGTPDELKQFITGYSFGRREALDG